MALIKKLRKAKKDAPAGEKPEVVRTHLRNMIIVPEMIGSVIGVYNGKTFNQVRQTEGETHSLLPCTLPNWRGLERLGRGTSTHPTPGCSHVPGTSLLMQQGNMHTHLYQRSFPPTAISRQGKES